MKTTSAHRLIVSTVFVFVATATLCAGCMYAAPWDPAAADYSGHKGKTLYVSKLGDNSDGSSWQKAFHTIQAALSAVPDNKGGHRIIVRPDTYVEANLAPAYPGAAGSLQRPDRRLRRQSRLGRARAGFCSIRAIPRRALRVGTGGDRSAPPTRTGPPATRQAKRSPRSSATAGSSATYTRPAATPGCSGT